MDSLPSTLHDSGPLSSQGGRSHTSVISYLNSRPANCKCPSTNLHSENGELQLKAFAVDVSCNGDGRLRKRRKRKVSDHGDDVGDIGDSVSTLENNSHRTDGSDLGYNGRLGADSSDEKIGGGGREGGEGGRGRGGGENANNNNSYFNKFRSPLWPFLRRRKLSRRKSSSRRHPLFDSFLRPRSWPRVILLTLTLVTLLLCEGMLEVTALRDVPDPSSKRLHHDLMSSYNALVKPSGGPQHQLTVKMGLRLSQVLDVDEKNQIITISVWLRQEWFDLRLKWDPSDNGGVTKLNIPSDDLWKPDIVLYNNADGDFVVTLKTKATVYHNGKIVWEPPAIYKSYCPINVEYFPFDVQECFMKFSSWTYNGNEVDLQHMCNGTVEADDSLLIARGIDMKDYYYNVEWDVLNVTARRNVKYYTCCPEPYPDITFNITLKRRTLFYTLNLIMPCIAISCLTVLVFYLPSDSGEKITLSISILLALTVFFLLLSDMNPPTSLVIPLIGKYLLFVMLVVTASIFLTVYTLHVNFNTPSTARMSPWVKQIFTEILPRALLMQRPAMEVRLGSQDLAEQSLPKTPVPGGSIQRSRASTPAPVLPPQHNRAPNGVEGAQGDQRDWSAYENLRHRRGSGESLHYEGEGGGGGGPESSSEEGGGGAPAAPGSFPKEVMEALKGVRFIANHLRQGDRDLAEERDWKYICMVIDRLFLYIFTAACLGGTLSIFLSAPSLYDPRAHIGLVDNTSNCQY